MDKMTAAEYQRDYGTSKVWPAMDKFKRGPIKPWSSAKKTQYNGQTYDSSLEAHHAAHLDTLLRANKIKAVERQFFFRLCVNGIKITGYHADFLITHPSGKKEVHECKGRISRDWTLRQKLFEALFPEIKLTVITKKI